MGRKPNWPPNLVRKPGTAEARTYHAGRWWTCGLWDVARGEATKEAIDRHHQMCGRWKADPGSAVRPRGEYLLADLWRDWAASGDGPRTAYARQMARLTLDSLGPLAAAPAAAFGPVELLAWQADLGERLAANTIRPMRAAVLQAFGWAEDAGRVPEGVAGRLERAIGRRKNRATPGRPMKPRPPAVAEHVAACLAVLDGRYPGVAALVRVHALVGSRVEELLELDAADVLKAGELVTPRGARLDLTKQKVWAAVCRRHKMEREKDRVLVFGPKARKLLAPLLKGCAGRVFDLQAGRTDNYHRGGDSLKARLHAYWRAVRYACLKAKVPHWTPRQLRQAVADRVRDALTAEHAAAYLGHGPKGVTERHYLTTALGKAAEAARAVG